MEELYYTNNPKDRAGECHADEATERLEQLVKRSKGRVRLSAQDPTATSRGRWKRYLAVKINRTWRDAGTIMVKEGHATWLSSRGEWLRNETYSMLAQRAATRRLGLWNPDGCGYGPFGASPLRVWANPDPEGSGRDEAEREWIKVKNLDPVNPVVIAGWWIRDSGLRRFVFPPGTTLPPNGLVTVHVGSGINSPTDLYWGLRKPIFDNVFEEISTGDGAYLFDVDGDLRASMTYPCRYACADPYTGAVEVTAAYMRRNEFVELRNVSTGPVDLAGYRLHSRPYSYAFVGDSVIHPGETMRVEVRGDPAQDTRLERHWGKTKSILNNGGDRVRLESLRYVGIACTSWGDSSC
jgi:hypothetical protein